MSSAVRLIALFGSSWLAACGGAPAPPAAAPSPAAPVVSVPAQAEAAAPLTTEAVPPAASAGLVSNAADPPRPPAGYLEMTVLDVKGTVDGAAVLLVNQARSVVVPIMVGGTEALSIQLRQSKQRYQRPLTHDLLDSILHELGGSLVKVQVDDIRDGTFIGTVFVRKGNRVVSIDARPSDAIALAIGNGVPIFMAQRVIDEAGLRKDASPGGSPGGAVPHI